MIRMMMKIAPPTVHHRRLALSRRETTIFLVIRAVGPAGAESVSADV